MLKEIKIVDEKKGIVKITTLNERYYAKQGMDAATGLPIYEYFPSSTFISSYYPKGIAFYKWLAEKGWNEAEGIKISAGDKGSKVHYACEEIDKGMDVAISSLYMNNSKGIMEELTTEEYDCIQTYIKFIEDYEPILISNELVGFGDFYAGTIDKIFAKDNGTSSRQILIVDLKTGQNIWTEQELQISSYSHMNINYKELGITDEEWAGRKLYTLQLGYRRNKKGYKFTEVEDQFEDFKTIAYRTWLKENPNSKPKERDYPLVLSSQFRKDQIAEQKKRDDESVFNKNNINENSPDVLMDELTIEDDIKKIKKNIATKK